MLEDEEYRKDLLDYELTEFDEFLIEKLKEL